MTSINKIYRPKDKLQLSEDESKRSLLIIGGTTEGRVAVQVCDEAGKEYYYSTRYASQQVECLHGKRISGELNKETMLDFCRQHRISLIVDAAHPFAENVHKNIGTTARELQIPIIRYERNFPEIPSNPLIHQFNDYSSAILFMEEKGISNLLALTGVNTIPKLKSYWEKHPCRFRIMKREESLSVVTQSGFPPNNILFYEDERDEAALFRRLAPEAILTKESGASGGFSEKVDTALALGIQVLIINRPPLPCEPNATIFGKHGLRKQIELLLPGFFELRTGYTTGSSATAAAKGALIALLSGNPVEKVTISLPNDEPITLNIAQTHLETDGSVTCTVIKDGGDDPDVTHGTEICANVALNHAHNEIRFLRGKGVGKVTLPGLGLEIGGPAINATPRKMMERESRETLERLSDDLHTGIDITISVPQGEILAGSTFNPRLGIVEGISIIGTSGVVKPYSSEAFIGSIRRGAQVAKALGAKHLILNSGAKSERYLKSLFPDAPPQAFIQYGNFIGETLKIASEEGFEEVTLGIMIGKAVKLAEGILDTHSKKSVMNKTFIQSIAKEARCSANTIEGIGKITLARELWQLIPSGEKSFFELLLQHCRDVCHPLLPNTTLNLLLLDDEGKYSHSPIAH